MKDGTAPIPDGKGGKEIETPEGYKILGFFANPFNSNTAEREPRIDEYAVHPPYLDRTKEASYASGAFFLEGARGSGKSATRLTIAKELFKGPGGQLVIPFTNFNVFRPYIKIGFPLELFSTQIAFLAVETLLTWMSTLAEEEHSELVNKTKSSEKLINKFVSDFYLNRSDHARSTSASEAYQLLDTSNIRKATIWTEKRKDQIAGIVARLASAFGKKYAEVDIGDPSAFQKLIESQRSEGFQDPKYVLERIVQLSKVFGFSGVLIQVDKVDETDWTGSDVSAAADLIVPLLANINLHEVQDLTWTFFIWDEVSK